MFATAVLCSSGSVSCSVAADDVQTEHSDDIAFTKTTTTTTTPTTLSETFGLS